MDASTRITQVSGRAIPLRGNDIDTDRIIPARFLRCVVFDGIGEHAFEDDRKGLRAKGQTHAFDDPRYQGSSVLLVNKNFGCGSSREHAPQALMRWGVKAIVGESFAEIFFGNCVSLGIPCVTADESTLQRLQKSVEADATANWTLDLESLQLRGPHTEAVSMPVGARSQFQSGQWNPMRELLTHVTDVDKVALALPYVSGRWG